MISQSFTPQLVCLAAVVAAVGCQKNGVRETGKDTDADGHTRHPIKPALESKSWVAEPGVTQRTINGGEHCRNNRTQ